MIERSTLVKMAERYYKRIEWEISDYYNMHKVTPNYIIFGEDIYDTLIEAKETVPEFSLGKQMIFGITFTVEENAIGFKIGYMKNISF